MLNNVPENISPELLKCLMEMGHGDELLIADANYPAVSNNTKVIRADGVSLKELLNSILHLMPLDDYAEYQLSLMKPVKNDPATPEIWHDCIKIINKYFIDLSINYLERTNFYNYSKNCFAIVQTSECTAYGNLIIKKGVVKKFN